jgi:hypothetical protein
MRSIVPLPALALALAIASSEPQASQVGASRVALATVADPRNRPLVDLGADDFVIQEAGVAREVLSLRPADYPIVILIDTGAGARDEIASIRKAVERFIDRLGPRPIAIATFGDPPAMLTTFDDDRSAIASKLDAAVANPTGASALTRGAALAGQAILAVRPLFSAIVILSGTPLGDAQDLPEDVLAPIIDSAAVVHVIANMPPASGGSSRGAAAIRSLAEQTHGELTAIFTSASYQAALDRLADRLTAEMMVEYLVPPGSKPVDVKVGVRIPGARVRGLGVAPR